MIKRLPYLALAVILAISTCVLMGGKVRAASPILYDGQVCWAIARRNSYANQDFNYTTLTEDIPKLGSMASINYSLCGIPSNRGTDTFTNIPSYITVKSVNTRQNGGYIYLAFAIGHCTDSYSGMISTLNLDFSKVKAYLWQSGSLIEAKNNGQSLSVTSMSTQITNTSFQTEYNDQLENVGLHIRGNVRYDGSNFPHQAYIMSSSQFLDDYGVSYSTSYDFGDTSVNWSKSLTFALRIQVPMSDGSPINNLKNVVWIDLSEFLAGTFKSAYDTCVVIDNQGNVVDQPNVYISSCIYLLPVYAYCTSLSTFLDVEQYLFEMNSRLRTLQTQNTVDQNVVDSYAALASEARQAASDAVRAMSVAAPSFQASDYDVFDNVDSVAMQQFSSIVGFLSLRRILPILLAALALVTIGYLFFGKK